MCICPTDGLSARQPKRASLPRQVIDHLALRQDAPNFAPAATQYPLNAVANHVVRGLNPDPRVLIPGNTVPVVSDGLPAYTEPSPGNNIKTPADRLLPP